MNHLRLFTVPTPMPNVFETLWSTGMVVKGVVRSRMPPMEDARMAAEMAVAYHLLVERNVSGHNKTGAGLILDFSGGVVRKLLREESEKPHLARYANFLRTRFLGCEIRVENRHPDWATDDCYADLTDLVVAEPAVCCIDVPNLGPCELTGHAVDQFQARFGLPPVKIWSKFCKIAKTLRPAENYQRRPVNDVKHRRPGARWVTISGEVGVVITPPTRPGRRPAIVTVLALASG